MPGRLSKRGFWKCLFVLLSIFVLRHASTFLNRSLLWDDLTHLSEASSWESFKLNALYTHLHFIPLMKFCYFLMMRFFPLHLIPAGSSFFCFFWVFYFVWAYLRLLKVYGVSELSSLVSLGFILLNPLLSENIVWLCSNFYLVATVFVAEGLYQLELAFLTNRLRNWFGALLCGVLAPCLWSVGYILPFLYLVTFLFHLKSKKSAKISALITIGFSVIFYPALRILGESHSGHDYTGISTHGFLPWIGNMLRIFGDGLLGSFGLWGRHPFRRNNFPDLQLNVLTIALWAYMLTQFKNREQRKPYLIAMSSLGLGLGVPYLFRGSQFNYEDLRWFIRYFATPLFGAGIILALSLDRYVLGHKRRLNALVFGLICFVIFSFQDRMPEHYIRGGVPQGKSFRQVQVRQLAFLETFFKQAREFGIRKDDLQKTFYIMVVGERFRNGVSLYHSIDAKEHLSLAKEVLLRKMITDEMLWKGYASYHEQLLPIPNLGFPKETEKLKVESSIPLKMNNLKLDGKDYYSVIAREPSLDFPVLLKVDETSVFRFSVDFMTQAKRVFLVTLFYRDANTPKSSFNVECEGDSCAYRVQLGNLSYVSPGALEFIRVTFDNREKSFYFRLNLLS